MQIYNTHLQIHKFSCTDRKRGAKLKEYIELNFPLGIREKALKINNIMAHTNIHNELIKVVLLLMN